MALFVAGLSHKNAPVELREQLAVEEDKLRELLRDIAATGVVQETLILSTCNRVEVYGVAEAPGEARAVVFRQLCRYRGVSHASVEPLLYTHVDDAAVPRLPGRREPRLDADRRTSDPGSGEGRVRPRAGVRDRRAGAAHALHSGVRRRQEGPE